MFAVAVTGAKKSGKTALLGLLASALEARGKSVGIIKFSGHDIGRQNTDAFWLMREGRTVAGCGPEESVLFWSPPLAFNELASLMKKDVILVESSKIQTPTPQIICLKDEGDAAELLAGAELLPEERAALQVMATVGPRPIGLAASLPKHFADATPESAGALAAMIIEKSSLLPGLACGECARLEMEILVDGQPVKLDPFAASIVSNTIQSILLTNKLYAAGQDVTINLKS